MVTLHLGDCLEILPTLEAQSIDAIITDLPYGTTACAWDTVIPFAPMWEQVNRLIRSNGAIVFFGVQPFTSALVMSYLQGYKHRWIWDKALPGNFAVAKYMPLTIDEDILVFTANGERVNYYPQMTKGKFRNKGGGHSHKSGRGFGGLSPIPAIYNADYFPKNILRFPTLQRRDSLHESQKPIELLAYLIRTYTNAGDTVLDFCMGSGTTGVAAIKEGRHFVGVELDTGYFAIAEKRIAEAQYQLPLLEFS